MEATAQATRGNRVSRSDVLHVEPSHPHHDRCRSAPALEIESASFDCIVVHRRCNSSSIRPRRSRECTGSSWDSSHHDRWHIIISRSSKMTREYWRFTSQSLQRLFEALFSHERARGVIRVPGRSRFRQACRRDLRRASWRSGSGLRGHNHVRATQRLRLQRLLRIQRPPPGSSIVASSDILCKTYNSHRESSKAGPVGNGISGYSTLLAYPLPKFSTDVAPSNGSN